MRFYTNKVERSKKHTSKPVSEFHRAENCIDKDTIVASIDKEFENKKRSERVEENI